MFARIHQAYSEGRIPGTGIGGSSEGRNRSMEIDVIVLDEVASDTSTSVRKISQTTGIPKSTVHNVLKTHKYHPYHLQRVQTLQPADYPRRVEFCRIMLRKINENSRFFDKIMWSDESACRKDGYQNLHNLHNWALENPHATIQDRSQTQFKINLWTGILNGQIIGPYELPSTLTGESYLHFLQFQLPTLLEEVPLQTRQNMWLQNDGCPAHYARNVRNYLNGRYPRRWIGRLGPIAWPPRSPDLNPLDFFYWGCLKDLIYNEHIRDTTQLREKIRTAAEQISRQGYAQQIRRSFVNRCIACIRANGGNFEHLL